MAVASKTLGAAGEIMAIPVRDSEGDEAVVQLSGTFTGSLVAEGTVDGSNFETLEIAPVGGGAAVTSIGAPGAWRVNVAGLQGARVRAVTLDSGAAEVSIGVARA